jgi:hypothetical protein
VDTQATKLVYSEGKAFWRTPEGAFFEAHTGEDGLVDSDVYLKTEGMNPQKKLINR